MKSLCQSFFTFLMLVVATPAWSHSGDGPPLFVANGGKDAGDCTAIDQPCRTLGYALSRANKGSEIRVAAGKFELTDPADLFQVVSGIVNVRGSFSEEDRFVSPGLARTTVTGVPVEYRSLFDARGFHVIADSKGNSAEQQDRSAKFVAQHGRMQKGLPAEPCSGGLSGGLDCENLELLAHVPFGDVSGAPSSTTDIWGFVDLNTDREYAIVGYDNGTAVFDVTDPSIPREVGFIDGQRANWRDIKVFQHYDDSAGRWQAFAYITTDGSTDGLFVIDLGGLPHYIARAGYAGDFSAAHNLFAAHTDYGTGISLTGATPSLIIAGANMSGGLFRPYSLENPRTPSFIALPNGSNADYMHDAATLLLTDDRKDTQCVNAGEYCEVLFDFNESTVDIWDITDPANTVRLSRTPYNNASYTHSGWPSEDGRFLFVHDELDERNAGLPTTVRVFSLDNLAAPAAVGSWTGPTGAIDHNGFVRGNRYYMSNYSRGLTVLDISDPSQPASIGRLDTYPFGDNASFVGAWGVYPYFHSGTLGISDISSGLYLVADRTRESAAGRLSFSENAYGVIEGGSGDVTVERTGGSTGAISVEVRYMPATASNDDVAETTALLEWADGDATLKTWSLQALEDGADEGLERALLSLAAPTGGAALGDINVSSAWLEDIGQTSTIEFEPADIDVPERGFATAVVVVQRLGSAAGMASVEVAISGGTAAAGSDFEGPASETLTWQAGDANPKSIEFTIVDDGTVEDPETILLTLSAPVGASLGGDATKTINVLDGDGANQAPNAIAGANQTVSPGTLVTLSGSASNDPDGDDLAFSWQQTAGTAVDLDGSNSADATFVAPEVSSDTLLRFELTVTDTRGMSDSSTINVTVDVQDDSNGLGSSGGGGGAVTWISLLMLLSAVSNRRRAIRTGAA